MYTDLVVFQDMPDAWRWWVERNFQGAEGPGRHRLQGTFPGTSPVRSHGAPRLEASRARGLGLCSHHLEILKILSLNLCFVSEVIGQRSMCKGPGASAHAQFCLPPVSRPTPITVARRPASSGVGAGQGRAGSTQLMAQHCGMSGWLTKAMS